MADTGSPSSRLRELCRDQRDRWLHGERIFVEAYLDRDPQLGNDEKLLLDLIYAEFCLREEVRESPTCDEYLKRFPHFAAQLRPLLELHHAVEMTKTYVAGNGKSQALASEFQASRGEGGANSADHNSPLQIAPTIPGYAILEELNRGGMGIIYKAQQLGLNRIVALKMILTGPYASADDVARFRGEAEAAARLQHPNIVQIFHIGEHAGRPYFALEFVDGGNLGQQLAGTPLAPRDAAAISETLARAVEYAHEQGVLHRDLKPANVLLQPVESRARPEGDSTLGDEETTTTAAPRPRRGRLSWRRRSAAGEEAPAMFAPKITDWGLAKRLDAEQGRTQSGAIMGTPSYMAPEQAAGGTRDVGRTADVYSLGAILYEMLTGRPPFRGATVWETLQQTLVEEPVPPSQLQPALPRDLETICLKCIEKEPAKRYSSAAALADDLRRFSAGEPIAARPVRATERAWRWARRKPLLATLYSAIAVLLAVVVIVPSLLALRLDATTRTAIQNEFTATENAQRAREKEQEATRQQNIAKTNEATANRQRARADQSERSARRRQYAAQVNLAHIAYEQGQMPRAITLLESLRPKFDEEDLRGFEWYYLWNQCDAHRFKTLRGHSLGVRALAFSSDGKSLYSGSNDRTVQIWNVASGRHERLQQPASVTSLALSGDERLLAVGLQNGAIQFWKRQKNHWQATDAIRIPGEQIDQIALSANGKTLATCFGTQNGKARIWDTVSRRVVAKLGDATAIAMTRDGNTVAVGAIYGRPAVTLWNMSGSSWRRHDATERAQELKALAFAPDGRTLAAGGYQQTLILWDTAALREIARRRCDSGAFNCLTFTPDGKTVVCGSSDHSLRFWTLATGKERQQGDLGPIFAVTLSPDGKLLASGNEDGEIKLWTADSRTELSSYSQPYPVNTLDIQAEGDKLLVATSQHTLLYRRSPGRPFPGTEVGKLKDGRARFSPDGTKIAVASWDGTVTVYDPLDGKERRSFQTRTRQGTFSLAFSPNGKCLATTGSDKLVILSDLETGRELRTLPLNSVGTGVAFSPDGRLLASSTAYGEIKLWDAANGKEVRTFPNAPSWVNCVAFSPDGSTLAASSYQGHTTLWDVGTSMERMTLHGHSAAVNAIAYSATGKDLATGSDDRTIKIWDLISGQERLTLRGHADAVTALHFDRNSGGLYSASSDGAVRLWSPTTDADATSRRDESRCADASGPRQILELALQYQQNGQTRAALETYDQALSRLNELVAANPNEPRYLALRASAILERGDCQFAAGDFKAASAAAQEGAICFEKLLRGDPGACKYLRLLSLSLRYLGRSLAAENQQSEALNALRRAADVQLEMLDRLPAASVGREDLDEICGLLIGTGHTSDAVAIWERDLKARPASPDSLLALARVFDGGADASLRDARKALEFAEKARQVAPQECGPLLLLAELRLKSADKEGSLSALSQATELFFSNENSSANGDAVKLTAAWRQAFEEPGASEAVVARWFAILGPHLFKDIDWNKWAGISELAVQIAPKDANAWSVVGLARSAFEDWNGANEAFQKAIDFKLDPASPVFPILALIRSKTDVDLETGTDACLRAADWIKEHADWLDTKPGQAAVIHRMQAEASQNLVERWRQLAVQDAYARDKGWKGVSDCTSALRLDPKNVDLLSLRCRLRTGDDQWAAAVDDATQAIAIRPKEGQYRSERGIAEFLLARYDEATVDLKQSIDLGFLNSAQLLRYAECLLQKAMTDRPDRASAALAEYRRLCALALDRFKGTKNIWEAHWISRMCTLVPNSVSDDRPVLQLAELGIKAIPKHRRFVDNMALLHLRSCQYDKAIERARQSLTLKPKVARGLTWLELSIAESHLGHAEAAREWFQKADAWVNEQSQRLAKYPNARPDEFWFEVRLLQHEAKALLAGKKSAWE